jgi:hypothetical protein
MGQVVTSSGNVYLNVRWDSALGGLPRSAAAFTASYYIATGGGYLTGNGGGLGTNTVYPMLGVGGTPGVPGQPINRYYTPGGKANWEVSRHAPRGFQFGPVTANEGDYGGLSEFTEHVSGHVCGENPFQGDDQPWDVPFDIADSGNGKDEAYDLTEPLLGPGIQGEASASNPPIPPDPNASHYPDMLWYAPRLTFLNPGPNPQMRIERFTDGGLHVDTTVPIAEDMSCPAPTP